MDILPLLSLKQCSRVLIAIKLHKYRQLNLQGMSTHSDLTLPNPASNMNDRKSTRNLMKVRLPSACTLRRSVAGIGACCSESGACVRETALKEKNN